METKTFKTKTITLNRNNGQIAGVYPVGLDTGYSGVKIYSPNKAACFPSFAKPYVNKGIIGDLPSDFIAYTDLETGENWLIGSNAQADTSVNEAIESDEALLEDRDTMIRCSESFQVQVLVWQCCQISTER